jgi:exopolysaccharide biosynthesis polyprenyl glycosylphosphotransferase
VVPPSLLRAPSVAEGAVPEETQVREGLYRRTLGAADALVALVVVGIVVPLVAAQVSWVAIALAPPLLVVLAKIGGLYDRDELVLNKSTLDEAPGLLQLAAMFTFIGWLALAPSSDLVLTTKDAVTIWAVTLALLLGFRGVGRALAGRHASTERCLAVGDRDSIDVLAAKLESARLNSRVVASMTLEDAPVGERSGTELLWLLRQLVAEHDIQRVLIAPASLSSDDTTELVRAAKHVGVRVSLLPRVMDVVGSAVGLDYVEGLTLLGVRRFGLSRSSRLLKRSFDLAGAGILFVATAPLMAAIALLVRFDPAAPGPVLFRQTRVGREGRKFEMLKFRSMAVGAEDGRDELRHLNVTVGLFKVPEDPRVTRVGKILRKTSLDELPQLINVLCGQMSLVGPRPLVVDEDEMVVGLNRQRLHLTPGMSGPWQILGANRVPMDEMVGIDYLYVANWSLWGDVKILLRTIPHVIGRKGL